MGLVPEFFILLGIVVFLALSLLSALLEGDVPSFFQYLFQGTAIVGLGLLLTSQSLVNAGILALDPTDVTRFWLSIVYLASAVSCVVGLNVYFAAVRREVALSSIFTGTVALPTLMVSVIFVSSFLGNGEVSFTPAAVMMLAAAALVISVSIFGFLRQVSRRLGPYGRWTSPTGVPIVSEVAGVSETPGAQRVDLPLHPLSKQGEEWEESPTKEGAEE